MSGSYFRWLHGPAPILSILACSSALKAWVEQHHARSCRAIVAKQKQLRNDFLRRSEIEQTTKRFYWRGVEAATGLGLRYEQFVPVIYFYLCVSLIYPAIFVLGLRTAAVSKTDRCVPYEDKYCRERSLSAGHSPCARS